MRNYKHLTITILFLTILLASCSGSRNGGNDVEKINEVTEEKTTEQIKQKTPEPYTKAITAINNENWELANTYLDLVISDFPDSEYILPTYILKGAMQVSQIRGAYDLLDIFHTGVNPESSLYDEDDIITIRRHTDLIKDIFGESLLEQEGIFTYIIQNFEVDKDYSEYYKNIKSFPLDTRDSDSLSFFESVGHPVPSDSEVKGFLDNKYDINISVMINEITNKPEHLNYNYLLLFYNAGMVLNEEYPELATDMFKLILEITSDDTYNEYRIFVEKKLQTSTTGAIQNESINDSDSDVFEWGTGMKEEFENQMIQNEYVASRDKLIYKDGYIGEDNQGYYGVYTIEENGEERYIVTVNVKTGWYHG